MTFEPPPDGVHAPAGPPRNTTVDEAVRLLVAAAADHERAGRHALARSHIRHAQALAVDGRT